jgi:putative ABC transport system ATP-binding protein
LLLESAWTFTLSILEAIDVWKECGTGNGPRIQALRGVSLCIERGEFVAVMGPSGCGKSTLLHVRGGIDTPTTGRVLLDGADLGGLTDTARSVIRRRRLGFVFQKMNLLPTLSALENVALPLRIDGVSHRAANDRAREALNRVDIEKRATHLPHEMSGGEQQRVAIARALVINPAVLMADEPTGALDSTNSMAIRQLLRANADRGQTVIVVTHDSAMAADADRILAMRDGEMLPTLVDAEHSATARAS